MGGPRYSPPIAYWAWRQRTLGYPGAGVGTGTQGQAAPADLAGPVPAVTGYTGPAGYAVTASSELGAPYYSWHAYDQNSVNKWAPTATTGWVALEMPGTRTAISYSITTSGGGEAGMAPRSWTFEGSNDGAAWTVLDTQANVDAPAPITTTTYTIASPGSYSNYRLNVTASNNAGNLVVAEVGINV